MTLGRMFISSDNLLEAAHDGFRITIYFVYTADENMELLCVQLYHWLHTEIKSIHVREFQQAIPGCLIYMTCNGSVGLLLLENHIMIVTQSTLLVHFGSRFIHSSKLEKQKFCNNNVSDLSHITYVPQRKDRRRRLKQFCHSQILRGSCHLLLKCFLIVVRIWMLSIAEQLACSFLSRYKTTRYQQSERVVFSCTQLVQERIY